MNITKLLAVLVAMLALSLSPARAASLHWTNTLGGNWDNPLNWSPNQVPGTNDNPFITAGGTYTVTMHSVAVRNLTVGGPSGTQTVVIPQTGFFDSYSVRFHGDSLFASNTILNVAGGVFFADVVGDGRITTHGLMNLTACRFFETVAMTIATNGILNLSGPNEFRGVITNAGRITWSGSGNLVVGYGFNLYNLAGGVFDVQNDQMMVWNPAGGATVYNAGLFRKSAGSGATTFSSVGFINTGTVEVKTGLIDFPYVGLVQTAGVLLLNGGNVSSAVALPIAGGLIGGSGQIQGDVRMSGQLSPGLSAGRVGVQGNYVQKSSGSYNVELGGTLAFTNYDQLVVTSNATLAGTINVISINGFVPALGDRFEILKFASKSGSVTFQGLDITNGISLLPVFSATNLVLVATNAPLRAAPKMNLARNGDSLWLWWPLGYSGFNVQSTTNLNAPIAWSPVNPAEINRHTFNATEPMKFYRMIKP